MDTPNLKRNNTGSVFHLGDGGSPEPDLSIWRIFSPRERVVLRLDIESVEERRSVLRAEVLEDLGDSLRVRVTDEPGRVPGCKVPDRGEVLEVARSRVFGVIASA